MEDVRKKKKNKRKENIGNRLSVVFIMLAVILFGIAARLTYIMVFKSQEYSVLASEQWTDELKIDAKRGRILDRNGIELAVSANVYRVDLDLDYMRKMYRDKDVTDEEIANKLAGALGMDDEEVLKILRKTTGINKMPAKSATLVRRIEKEQADKVKELKINDKSIYGVIVSSDTKRYYTNNNFLSHVLGSINGENVGINGIEATYNKELTGVAGVRITEVDRNNRDTPYTQSQFAAPVDGKDVTLTIDEKIQYFAEKVAEKGLTENKADAVTIIVTNPNNGEVLAMANKPDFNPNSPYDGSSNFNGETESERLQSMWKNKAVESAFEPGSIFKIITAAAAVEEGIAGHDETYYCSGFMKIGNSTIRCWKSEGHGVQTFNQILENSCNPAFMEIGLKLGREKLNDYIYKFGFGKKSLVDLPAESSGIVKETDKITDMDLAAISFGQTDSVNAIQFMAAMNAAINGGTWIQPHFMKEISHIDSMGAKIIDEVFKPVIRNEIISETTSDRLNIALESTVKNGSGKPTYIEGYGIAGKSGTGEKVDSSTGTYGAGYVSSFVGFAPYDNPQVSIMISVDNPTNGEHFGGVVAAPLAKDLFTEILNYLDGDTLKASGYDSYPVIPDIRGMSVNKAKDLLEKLNIKFKIEGDDNFITDVNPMPGYRVSSESEIVITTGRSLTYNKEVIVPDFRGYTKEEVQNILSQLKLKGIFEGDGVVIKQTIKYGELVKSGDTIKFTLEIQ